MSPVLHRAHYVLPQFCSFTLVSAKYKIAPLNYFYAKS